MDDLAREYVISFYNRTLRMHGDRPEALRWTPEGQVRHYEALLDIASDSGGSGVLDFGCGRGDFLAFLKERGIAVRYTGVDINGSIVALAREKHPGADFRVFDIERDTLDEEFDYIFLCGVFNLKVQGVEDLTRYALKKLFRRCRIAMACNAPSTHAPEKDYELHYTSPDDLFSFAVRDLSPFVAVRHDRMAYDFTMFVYREVNGFSPP